MKKTSQSINGTSFHGHTIKATRQADDMTYAQCEALLRRVESMGCTFDYGLDAAPYNLRPIASQDGPVR